MSNTIFIPWTKPRNVANVIGRDLLSIVLPAFNYTGLTWKGASQILGQTNFVFGQSLRLINVGIPDDVRYVLCVRWKDVDGNVVRYKLWDGVNELLYYPVYTNELILGNFSIEVWSVNNGSHATLSEVLVLQSGVFANNIHSECEIGFTANPTNNTGTVCASLQAGLPFNGVSGHLSFSDCAAGVAN